MRYRTRKTVYFARPQPLTDAYGGVTEAYSAARAAVTAQVLPASGAVVALLCGERVQDARVLLLPRDAALLPRDGVWLEANGAQPDFRCLRVERFPLHARALIERR